MVRRGVLPSSVVSIVYYALLATIRTSSRSSTQRSSTCARSFCALREATEAAGQELVERLPVYPEFILGQPDFFDPKVREALPRFATDDGYARSPKQSGEEAA